MALRTMALCAGVGGLEGGVALVADVRVVCAVERAAYPAAVLVARMEEETVVAATERRYPIWDDLSTFDGRPWFDAVDLITAGYPCQPESLAGGRLGEADERWLWSEVYRVIREVRPALVFLENVPGHLSGTFGRVLGDLAALGRRIEWDCVPASTVGAPHVRDRVFVLVADPDRFPVRLEPERDQRRRRRGPAPKRRHAKPVLAGVARHAPDAAIIGGPWPRLDRSAPIAGRDGKVADADGNGRQRERISGVLAGEWTSPRRDADGLGGAQVADADHESEPARQRPHRDDPAVHRGHAADADAAARSGARREPAEPPGNWWQRTPAPEPTFRRVDARIPSGVDGCELCVTRPGHCARHYLFENPVELDRYWADQIHALGNGVVREAAARAFRTLYGRLTGDW